MFPSYDSRSVLMAASRYRLICSMSNDLKEKEGQHQVAPPFRIVLLNAREDFYDGVASHAAGRIGPLGRDVAVSPLIPRRVTSRRPFLADEGGIRKHLNALYVVVAREPVGAVATGVVE